jgi:ATP-dependent Clp protease ATP-binding subunit ClpA
MVAGDGAMDAANLLKPMLARGQLRCIGATTLNEYQKYVETPRTRGGRAEGLLMTNGI